MLQQNPLAVRGRVLHELPECLLTGTLDTTKPLAAVLFNLGIPIFDQHSVDEYKSLMVARHPANFFGRHPIIADYFIGMVLVAIVAIVALVLLNSPESKGVVIPIAILGFVIAVGVLPNYQVVHAAHWVITGYRKAPAEVQDLAGRLAGVSLRAGPVRIYAESLKQKTEILDPFLLVECAATHETYYVAVWDEPDFKEHRVI